MGLGKRLVCLGAFLVLWTTPFQPLLAYWPTLPPRWHYRGLFKNWEGWRYAHDWKPCTETGEEYGDLVTYCTNDKEEHQRIKKYKKLGPPQVWIYYFGT